MTKPDETKRAVHDLGGLPAGKVDTHEHTPTLTERRIDALMMLLRERGVLRTDENRRTIEGMTPGMYNNNGYYELWVRSLHGLLVEKGVLNEAEVAARLAEVRGRFEGQVAVPSKARMAKSQAGKSATPSKAGAKGDRR
jgi:nitrile hydratase subunit beta